jgi:hypothetical protein
MSRIPIPITHGASYDFCRDLRDAFFIPNPEDAKLVELILKKKVSNLSDEYLRKRVRRYVPEPLVLEERLQKVFMKYDSIIDAKSKKPLLSDAAKDVIKNILVHVRNGCVSDGDANLYIEEGKDQKGIPSPSTNAVEEQTAMNAFIRSY